MKLWIGRRNLNDSAAWLIWHVHTLLLSDNAESQAAELMRTYAKVILAVLVLGGFLGGIVWGIGAIYDAGGDAREDQVKRAFAEEKARLLEELDEARSKAETRIIEDRIVYRDRIQKIREVVTDFELPADLIGVLRESGVFTGR